MMPIENATTATVLAQAERTGPQGPEFGKAAPVGLLVIVVLLAVVLAIGVLMNKRIRRLERRRAFAEKHGIDMFDTEALERAMREEGFDDRVAGSRALPARTDVPESTQRFSFSGGERSQAADRSVASDPATTGGADPAEGRGERGGTGRGSRSGPDAPMN